jgi:hypothetical protein
MPKRTIALIVVLILVTVGLLYLALAPKQSTPPVTQPSVTPTPAAQTRLFLSPNPLSVASASGSINVDIDTSENMVTAVQLELIYDPKVLTAVDIASPSANSFFANPIILLKKIDPLTGKISYALGIPPTGKGVKGNGTVATITFRKLIPSGQTTVSVLPETQVTAEGVTGSVLKEALGATIILSSTPTSVTNPSTPPSTGSATPSQ